MIPDPDRISIQTFFGFTLCGGAARVPRARAVCWGVTTAVDGERAFEVGARYRTRVAIDALRDRFVAGEVLVYWRYATSHHDNARGWFFRQPGRLIVRSYDLLGGEPLRRDELFEQVAGPAPVVAAAAGNEVAGIERALATGDPSDPEVTLDRELAAERALDLDHGATASAVIARGVLDEDARIRLLHVAARHGRARAIIDLLATGLPADAAPAGQQTALVGAVFGAHVDAVRVLLAAGADPDRPQPGGTTARAFARDPRIRALFSDPVR